MPTADIDEDQPNVIVPQLYLDRLTTTRRIVLVAVGLGIISCVLGCIVFALTRANVQAATEARAYLLESAERQNQILDQIRSCTTPDGECAQRSADSGSALGAAISYCTDHVPDTALKAEYVACLRSQFGG